MFCVYRDYVRYFFCGKKEGLVNHYAAVLLLNLDVSATVRNDY